jgi:hypothetical protein
VGLISQVAGRLRLVPLLFDHFLEDFEYIAFPGLEGPSIVLTDFAPRVFEGIRSMFGQTEKIYMESLGTEDVLNQSCVACIGPTLRDVVSTSRSGSIFFSTLDQR